MRTTASAFFTKEEAFHELDRLKFAVAALVEMHPMRWMADYFMSELSASPVAPTPEPSEPTLDMLLDQAIAGIQYHLNVKQEPRFLSGAINSLIQARRAEQKRIMSPDQYKRAVAALSPTQAALDQKLSKLVLELAEAVDNSAADVGGSRSQLDILREAVQVAVSIQSSYQPTQKETVK